MLRFWICHEGRAEGWLVDYPVVWEKVVPRLTPRIWAQATGGMPLLLLGRGKARTRKKSLEQKSQGTVLKDLNLRWILDTQVQMWVTVGQMSLDFRGNADVGNRNMHALGYRWNSMSRPGRSPREWKQREKEDEVPTPSPGISMARSQGEDKKSTKNKMLTPGRRMENGVKETKKKAKEGRCLKEVTYCVCCCQQAK